MGYSIVKASRPINSSGNVLRHCSYRSGFQGVHTCQPACLELTGPTGHHYALDNPGLEHYALDPSVRRLLQVFMSCWARLSGTRTTKLSWSRLHTNLPLPLRVTADEVYSPRYSSQRPAGRGTKYYLANNFSSESV